MRDLHTNYPEDAARYEHHRALNDDAYDDRPSARELAEDDDHQRHQRHQRHEGRHRATPSIAETIGAALRWSDDRPTITQTRPGIVQIASTYTDERVATILRPLGIETGRGTDGLLYARDTLTSADPWGNPDADIGEVPF